MEKKRLLNQDNSKLLLLFFSLSLFTSCQHQLHWPQADELSCLTSPNREAFPRSSIQGPIWKKHTLEKNHQLKIAINQFASGHIGQKAKAIRLEGQTAQSIHSTLVNQGFRHQRLPLPVHPIFKPDLYWQKNGTQSSNKDLQSAISMDIYDHPDGSLVRVKPWGMPDIKLKTLSPQPIYTVSVVYDSSPKCFWGLFFCHLDTSWSNEAFKVDADGQPIPKAPTYESGLALDPHKSHQEQNQFKDAVMDLVHHRLPANYNHCYPAQSIYTDAPHIRSHLLKPSINSLIAKTTCSSKGCPQQSDLQEHIEIGQKHWLRKPNLERWELAPDPLSQHDQETKDIFENLSLLEEILPSQQKYQGIIILGATIQRMRLRWAFLLEQIQKGSIEPAPIFFLTGQRPRSKAVETEQMLLGQYPHNLKIKSNWTPPKNLPETETDMARLLVEQTQLPDILKNTKIYFVDTPLQATDSEKKRRPSNIDTIQFLQTKLPQMQGRWLAVSNNPHINYQNSVLQRYTPKEVRFETVGPKAEKETSFPVTLDAIARWLYQYKEAL